MPLNASAAESLAAGAPRVFRASGNIRIIQSRAAGWALTALGLGLLAAVLASGGRTLRLDDMTPIGYLGLAVFVLAFGGFALYGLFWLVWRRELTLDLMARRYCFVTGIWPRLHTFDGPLDALVGMELQRKTMHRSIGDPGSGVHGGRMESWQLDLSIPGAREPLFLGEWGRRADALAEVEAWRALLPHLALTETGDRR